MQVQTDTKAGEARIVMGAGDAIEVRAFNPHDAFTGHLENGDAVTFEDGCAAIRWGGKVVWREPAGARRAVA